MVRSFHKCPGGKRTVHKELNGTVFSEIASEKNGTGGGLGKDKMP
jgi:hypothetical protein